MMLSARAEGSCFNPRSPRGGATQSNHHLLLLHQVSIHAPHEGERHLALAIYPINEQVSIHAPHEGERQSYHQGVLHKTEVSIHAPHEGERLYDSSKPKSIPLFQSTLPTRGSDQFAVYLLNLQ